MRAIQVYNHSKVPEFAAISRPGACFVLVATLMVCMTQERMLALQGHVVALQQQLQQMQLERTHNQAQLAALQEIAGVVTLAHVETMIT